MSDPKGQAFSGGTGLRERLDERKKLNEVTHIEQFVLTLEEGEALLDVAEAAQDMTHYINPRLREALSRLEACLPVAEAQPSGPKGQDE